MENNVSSNNKSIFLDIRDKLRRDMLSREFSLSANSYTNKLPQLKKDTPVASKAKNNYAQEEAVLEDIKQSRGLLYGKMTMAALSGDSESAQYYDEELLKLKAKALNYPFTNEELKTKRDNMSFTLKDVQLSPNKINRPGKSPMENFIDTSFQMARPDDKSFAVYKEEIDAIPDDFTRLQKKKLFFASMLYNKKMGQTVEATKNAERVERLKNKRSEEIETFFLKLKQPIKEAELAQKKVGNYMGASQSKLSNLILWAFEGATDAAMKLGFTAYGGGRNKTWADIYNKNATPGTFAALTGNLGTGTPDYLDNTDSYIVDLANRYSLSKVAEQRAKLDPEEGDTKENLKTKAYVRNTIKEDMDKFLKQVSPYYIEYTSPKKSDSLTKLQVKQEFQQNVDLVNLYLQYKNDAELYGEQAALKNLNDNVQRQVADILNKGFWRPINIKIENAKTLFGADALSMLASTAAFLKDLPATAWEFANGDTFDTLLDDNLVKWANDVQESGTWDSEELDEYRKLKEKGLALSRYLTVYRPEDLDKFWKGDVFGTVMDATGLYGFTAASTATSFGIGAGMKIGTNLIIKGINSGASKSLLRKAIQSSYIKNIRAAQIAAKAQGAEATEKAATYARRMLQDLGKDKVKFTPVGERMVDKTMADKLLKWGYNINHRGQLLVPGIVGSGEGVIEGYQTYSLSLNTLLSTADARWEKEHPSVRENIAKLILATLTTNPDPLLDNAVNEILILNPLAVTDELKAHPEIYGDFVAQWQQISELPGYELPYAIEKFQERLQRESTRAFETLVQTKLQKYRDNDENYKGIIAAAEKAAKINGTITIQENSVINGMANSFYKANTMAPSVRHELSRTKRNLSRRIKFTGEAENLTAEVANLPGWKRNLIVAKNIIKQPFGEGLEEYLQNIASESSQRVGETIYGAYLNHVYDPEVVASNTESLSEFLADSASQSIVLDQAISAGLRGAADAAISKEAFRDGFYGMLSTGIGGASLNTHVIEKVANVPLKYVIRPLGAPFSKKARAQVKEDYKNLFEAKGLKAATTARYKDLREEGKGKLQAASRATMNFLNEYSPIGWKSTLTDAYREGTENDYIVKDAVDHLNSIMSDPNKEKLWDWVGAKSAINSAIDEALNEKDELALRDYRLMKMVQGALVLSLINRNGSAIDIKGYYINTLSDLANLDMDKLLFDDKGNLVPDENIEDQEAKALLHNAISYVELERTKDGSLNDQLKLARIKKNAAKQLEFIQKVQALDSKYTNMLKDRLSLDAKASLIMGDILLDEQEKRLEGLENKRTAFTKELDATQTDLNRIEKQTIARYGTADVKTLLKKRDELIDKVANLTSELKKIDRKKLAGKHTITAMLKQSAEKELREIKNSIEHLQRSAVVATEINALTTEVNPENPNVIAATEKEISAINTPSSINKNSVLTAADIMSLDNESIAKMLDPKNLKNYSEALQEVIKKLVAEGNDFYNEMDGREDPSNVRTDNFVSSVKDEITLLNSINSIIKDKQQFAADPEAIEGFAGLLKEKAKLYTATVKLEDLFNKEKYSNYKEWYTALEKKKSELVEEANSNPNRRWLNYKILRWMDKKTPKELSDYYLENTMLLIPINLKNAKAVTLGDLTLDKDPKNLLRLKALMALARSNYDLAELIKNNILFEGGRILIKGNGFTPELLKALVDALLSGEYLDYLNEESIAIDDKIKEENPNIVKEIKEEGALNETQATNLVVALQVMYGKEQQDNARADAALGSEPISSDKNPNEGNPPPPSPPPAGSILPPPPDSQHVVLADILGNKIQLRNPLWLLASKEYAWLGQALLNTYDWNEFFTYVEDGSNSQSPYSQSSSSALNSGKKYLAVDVNIEGREVTLIVMKSALPLEGGIKMLNRNEKEESYGILGVYSVGGQALFTGARVNNTFETITAVTQKGAGINDTTKSLNYEGEDNTPLEWPTPTDLGDLNENTNYSNAVLKVIKRFFKSLQLEKRSVGNTNKIENRATVEGKLVTFRDSQDRNLNNLNWYLPEQDGKLRQCSALEWLKYVVGLNAEDAKAFIQIGRKYYHPVLSKIASGLRKGMDNSKVPASNGKGFAYLKGIYTIAEEHSQNSRFNSNTFLQDLLADYFGEDLTKVSTMYGLSNNDFEVKNLKVTTGLDGTKTVSFTLVNSTKSQSKTYTIAYNPSGSFEGSSINGEPKISSKEILYDLIETLSDPNSGGYNSEPRNYIILVKEDVLEDAHMSWVKAKEEPHTSEDDAAKKVLNTAAAGLLSLGVIGVPKPSVKDAKVTVQTKQAVVSPSNKNLIFKQETNSEKQEETPPEIIPNKELNIDNARDIVKDILEDPEKPKLEDENGNPDSNAQYYTLRSTGDKYERATSMLPAVEGKDEAPYNSDNLYNTLAVTYGNTIDALVRAFWDYIEEITNGDYTPAEIKDFTDSLKQDLINRARKILIGESAEEGSLPNIPNEMIDTLIRELANLSQIFKAKGWFVVARDCTAYGTLESKQGNQVRVAGTLDLLVYDSSGLFRIIDIKSVRWHSGKPTSDLNGRRLKWELQTNIYKQLLQQRYPQMRFADNVPLAIFPVGVDYEPQSPHVTVTLDENKLLQEERNTNHGKRTNLLFAKRGEVVKANANDPLYKLSTIDSPIILDEDASLGKDENKNDRKITLVIQKPEMPPVETLPEIIDENPNPTLTNPGAPKEEPAPEDDLDFSASTVEDYKWIEDDDDLALSKEQNAIEKITKIFNSVKSLIVVGKNLGRRISKAVFKRRSLANLASQMFGMSNSRNLLDELGVDPQNSPTNARSMAKLLAQKLPSYYEHKLNELDSYIEQSKYLTQANILLYKFLKNQISRGDFEAALRELGASIEDVPLYNEFNEADARTKKLIAKAFTSKYLSLQDVEKEGDRNLAILLNQRQDVENKLAFIRSNSGLTILKTKLTQFETLIDEAIKKHTNNIFTEGQTISVSEQESLASRAVLNNLPISNQEMSAYELLGAMYDNATGETKHLLGQLVSTLSTSDLTISFANIDDPLRFGYTEVIELEDGSKVTHITLNLNVIKTDLDLKRAVLHEVIHACTHFLMGENEEIRSDIQDMINYAKTYLERKGIDSEEVYGLQSEAEFIAEFFSNPLFLETLKSIPASKDLNLFLRFINYICRKLFGNFYEQSATYLNEVMGIATLLPQAGTLKLSNTNYENTIRDAVKLRALVVGRFYSLSELKLQDILNYGVTQEEFDSMTEDIQQMVLDCC